MIMDRENLFSDGQAVTATANSTNIVDLKKTGLDIATGRPLQFRFQVDTTTTSGGSTTMTVAIVSSDATDLSTPTTHWTSASIAKATLVAGYGFTVTLPQGPYKRYLGVVYTVNTANFTAGAFTAALVLDTQSQQYLDSGLNVGGI